MIGNHGFEPGRHHLANGKPLFHDLRGGKLVGCRVRSPKMEDGLLLRGGHPFKQHLEIIDLCNPNPEVLGQAITYGRFSGPGSPPYQQDLPSPRTRSNRVMHPF